MNFLYRPLSVARLFLAGLCVVVITGHSKLDYRWIAQLSPILLDTVNVTGDFYRSLNNIIRLGAS